MQSKAATVQQYLAELPTDRRAAISAIRDVIRRNIDKTYEEGMQYGMIGWYVPHRVYPAGYHCNPKQPLPFAGLASQKNYMSLYLGCVYGDSAEAEWFRGAWEKTGRKLDMGKACIRFRKLEDVPLDVVGEAIRRFPAKKWIEIYETAIRAMNQSAAKKAARQTAKKSAGRASGKSAAETSGTPKRAAVKARARKSK